MVVCAGSNLFPGRIENYVLSDLCAFSKHLISVLVVVACHFNSILAQPTFAVEVSCFTAAESNEFGVA
jgi:hypothetical protein